MTDLLIRDIPDDVLVAIDTDASRLGLSRSEYLRRTLAQIAARVPGAVVRVEDLALFEALFADLANEEVMRQAWH